MAEDQAQQGGREVLGRLLRARDQSRIDHGAAPALPRPQPITTIRAASHAMARAVEKLYRLPAVPLELSPAAITLAEMAELLPSPALLSVVEGAGEAIGVVAICPTLMTALIEVETLGRITARQVEPRRPTRSDAMICADFVNTLLGELGEEMTRIDGFENFAGFRYASFMDDQRPLLLMLDDSPYRSLRFRLRLGQSPGREGEVFVALPQKQAATALPLTRDDRAAAPNPGIGQQTQVTPAAAEQPPAEPGPDIALLMREAPIDVIGVLCRRRLRLGLLRHLAPGQILPLPRVDLAETRLETRLGQLLAIGKLGESGGYHAIRLGSAEAMSAEPGAAPVSFSAGAAGSAARRIDAPALDDLPFEPPMADLGDPDGFRFAAADDMLAGEFAPVSRKSALSG